MSKDAIDGFVTVITAIIVIAILAVLVSKNAQTGSVLTAGGNALSNLIKAAVSPVSSASSTELGQLGAIG